MYITNHMPHATTTLYTAQKYQCIIRFYELTRKALRWKVVAPAEVRSLQNLQRCFQRWNTLKEATVVTWTKQLWCHVCASVAWYHINSCSSAGVDSGFKHVVPEGHDTKLYQVRRVHGKTTVLEVPVLKDTGCWKWRSVKLHVFKDCHDCIFEGYQESWDLKSSVISLCFVTCWAVPQDMINDGDSFVLNAPDKIYVFDGPQASPFEKRQANETAENMERSRPPDPAGMAGMRGEVEAGWLWLEVKRIWKC